MKNALRAKLWAVALAMSMRLATYGCALQPKPGVYTPVEATSQTFIADDAIEAIKKILPAANTVLIVPARPKSTFGRSIEKKLRAAGYQLTTNPKDPRGKRFDYIIDEAGKSTYFVSIQIATTRITKAFAKTDDGVEPASSWSHAEFSK